MKELAEAIKELNENKVYELVDQKVEGGVAVMEIIDECNQGMIAVGDLFSEGKYFISQLIFSAEILKNVMKKIDPLIKTRESGPNQGKVVIGTVKGDIHDIGKNIVVTLLRGAGFEVTDLGVDVAPESFVDALKETKARILGMSALLNFTYPEMKTVVEAVAQAGLRDQVTIILGGAPVNEQVREFAGADFAAMDAVSGLNKCKQVYGLA